MQIQSLTTPVQPRTIPPITSQDDDNLKVLAQNDMLHLVGDSGNSDAYGKSLNAFEARQLLAAGKPLVVTDPHLGSIKDTRYPETHSQWYGGDRVDPKVQTYVESQAVATAEREGAFVSDVGELNRFLQADHLTTGDEKSALSPQEIAASGSLDKFKGRLTGQLQAVFSEDDVRVGYVFKSKSDHGDGNDGLYNPSVKHGGVLGLGGHLDRLTPYEAMNLLESNQSVRVVHGGKADLLQSFDDLQAYDKLSR